MSDVMVRCEANIDRAMKVSRPLGGASQKAEIVWEALQNAKWLLAERRRLKEELFSARARYEDNAIDAKGQRFAMWGFGFLGVIIGITLAVTLFPVCRP